MVTVLLNETTTEIVLALPSFITASDMREVAVVDERNARYEATVVSHKVYICLYVYMSERMYTCTRIYIRSCCGLS
jgi:hypothetical protein